MQLRTWLTQLRPRGRCLLLLFLSGRRKHRQSQKMIGQPCGGYGSYTPRLSCRIACRLVADRALRRIATFHLAFGHWTGRGYSVVRCGRAVSEARLLRAPRATRVRCARSACKATSQAGHGGRECHVSPASPSAKSSPLCCLPWHSRHRCFCHMPSSGGMVMEVAVEEAAMIGELFHPMQGTVS